MRHHIALEKSRSSRGRSGAASPRAVCRRIAMLRARRAAPQARHVIYRAAPRRTAPHRTASLI
ncbi:uncharacterized protein LOC142975306 isoform X2 [Anticarsia gemmatalis]|uniref:uncharacterized protein LOC142975306 isoform X2 n=1 Tax=Anticarsia gemmatalis TaxID=129554 RepID=UPI003F777963